MEEPEKQLNSRGGYGSEELHLRIHNLIQESKDPNFTNFLNQVGSALWRGKMSEEEAEKVIDQNLKLYYDSLNNSSMPSGPSKSKKNVEFTIGTGVLGIMGAAFLLTALAIFTMNFMSGYAKSVGLYFVSAILIIIAELFVRKKKEKFAVGMAGAGVGGLYLTTVLNYLYFCTLNDFAAVIICLIITVIVFVWGKKRNSEILSVVSLLGSTVCLLSVSNTDCSEKFMIISGVIALIYLGGAFVSSSKQPKWAVPFQFVLCAVTTLTVMFQSAFNNIESRYLAVFILLVLVDVSVLFVRSEKSTADRVLYVISYLLLTVLVSTLPLGIPESYFFSTIPMAVLTAVFTVVLHKQEKLMWVPYWALHYNLFYLVLKLFITGSHDVEIFTVLVCTFILAEGLNHVKVLRFSEAVVSGCTFFYLLLLSDSGKSWMVAVITFLLAVSPFLSKYWQTYHRVLATLAVVTCTEKLIQGICPDGILLAIVTGILLLSILICRFFDKWKKAGVENYNIVMLILLSVCYFDLAFQDDIVIYLIMLCFGITIFVFLFDRKYELPESNKYLWLGIFLLYMILILRLENGMITSILLAADAIFCVAAGFAIHRKPVRIFGLIVAVLVSLKVAFIDNGRLDITQRVLAFLIVGLVILGISYIYFSLEKKIETKKDDGESKL